MSRLVLCLSRGFARIVDSRERTSSPRRLLLPLGVALLAGLTLTPQHALAVDSSFRRGDTNSDGSVNLADAIGLLDYLFSGNAPTPPCVDALDANDSGALDLADPIGLLSFLFNAGDPPPAPFTDCGPDPTFDTIDCIGPIPSCPLLIAPEGEFAFVGFSILPSLEAFIIPQPAPVDLAEFAGRKFGMRPFVISLDPSILSGSVRVESTQSAVTFYASDGTPLPLPLEINVADLPSTVLVNIDAPGGATLTLTATASGASAELSVVSGPFDGLAGTSLTNPPYFRYSRAIPTIEPEVAVAVDPTRFGDRSGQTYRLYIVSHRTLDEWALDQSLVDVSGGFETQMVGGISIQEGIVSAWSAPLDGGPLVSLGYDVVLDFGQDGFLDPGDVIDGLGQTPAFSVVNPLTDPGPYPVMSVDYSAGGFLVQRSYYPTNMATLDPLPLVIISHGNGHLYTWYNYLGAHLASHGYVVMSHANNTMPGIESASSTTLSNTNYFLSAISTIAGGIFDGNVDVERIAWIGHSRGGEGVVRAYDRVADGTFTSTQFDLEDIRVVSSIAPTVFLGVASSDPHDVPYHLLAGSSDGDVTGGVDCQICQFFRIARRGTGPVQVTYIQGASHNDFNSDGFDDGVGPNRIGRFAAQRLAKGYLLALVETYLSDNPATIEYLERSPDEFPLSAVTANNTVATEFDPAVIAEQLVIDDFQESPNDPLLSSAGWSVQTNFDVTSEEVQRDLNSVLTHTVNDPRNGMTQSGNTAIESESGLYVEWPSSRTRFYEWLVPNSDADWRRFSTLSLRGCQITRHPYTDTWNAALGFTITLTDGTGQTASLSTIDYAPLTRPYQRNGLGTGFGWSNEFNSIRIALTDFQAASNLDLEDIQSLRFDFGGGFGTPLGRIGLDDVQLIR